MKWDQDFSNDFWDGNTISKSIHISVLGLIFPISISEISQVQPSSNESALFNLGQIGWRNAMIICDKYQNQKFNCVVGPILVHNLVFVETIQDLNLALKSNTAVQCNLDLVTSYLVTNPDLVTILQKTIFLVHKNISFSDNLVFSATPIQ